MLFTGARGCFPCFPRSLCCSEGKGLGAARSGTRGLGAGGAQRGVLCPVVAKGLQLRGWQGKAGDEQLPSLMQAATLP